MYTIRDNHSELLVYMTCDSDEYRHFFEFEIGSHHLTTRSTIPCKLGAKAPIYFQITSLGLFDKGRVGYHSGSIFLHFLLIRGLCDLHILQRHLLMRWDDFTVFEIRNNKMAFLKLPWVYNQSMECFKMWACAV